MEVKPVIKNTKTLQNRGSQTVSVVPSLALFIDTLASPNATIKPEKQNINLIASILLNGKDATAFWKLVFYFEAMLKTTHIAN